MYIEKNKNKIKSLNIQLIIKFYNILNNVSKLSNVNNVNNYNYMYTFNDKN